MESKCTESRLALHLRGSFLSLETLPLCYARFLSFSLLFCFARCPCLILLFLAPQLVLDFKAPLLLLFFLLLLLLVDAVTAAL